MEQEIKCIMIMESPKNLDEKCSFCGIRTLQVPALFIKLDYWVGHNLLQQILVSFDKFGKSVNPYSLYTTENLLD